MPESGRPANRDTRARILEGAREALSRHGLAKLAMTDVSACAGVSRGTVYRYFPSLDSLLQELSRAEAERFRGEVLGAAREAPDAADRLRIVLEYATQHAQTHGALQRLLETDPGGVLRSIREQYPLIREELGSLLRPLLAESAPVAAGRVAVEPLLDALVRVLVAAYLFPGDEPLELKATVEALWGLVANGPGRSPPERLNGGPRRSRKPRR
jgi:AcrR family transcriptional regulator